MTPEVARVLVDAHLQRLMIFSFMMLFWGLTAWRRKPEGFKFGFATMTTAWSVINLAIVLVARNDRALPNVAGLCSFLVINLWLNLVYIVAGAAVGLRTKDRAQGAGWAVVVQGVALMVLDGLLYGQLMAK